MKTLDTDEINLNLTKQYNVSIDYKMIMSPEATILKRNIEKSTIFSSDYATRAALHDL
jgi:hypothetical protein